MFSHLSMFLHFFLTYFLPYLSYALRVDPLRFQAGCRKKVTKPGFSLLCLFCVVLHFFWLVNACFCCVTFGFPCQAKRLACENVFEMIYFVSSGTWSHHSVSQWWMGRSYSKLEWMGLMTQEYVSVFYVTSVIVGGILSGAGWWATYAGQGTLIGRPLLIAEICILCWILTY